jgi:ubiquinone/menaquinone biosynthesis C-methylase UbiE
LRKRPWYEEVFTRDYLAQYAHRSDEAAAKEVPFVIKTLDVPAGAHVLDLCCGAGRHSRELDKNKLRVTGFDLSKDLLQDAIRQTQYDPIAIHYVRGDMRQLPFQNECFDGVVNLFTSFGYFNAERQNQRVLDEVSRVLKKGAPFLMDYLNSVHTLKTLVKNSERQVGSDRMEERRSYDLKSKRLKKRTKTISERGVFVRTESVRVYTQAELKAMFRRSGLNVVAVYGDLDGAKFTRSSSPRCVLLAHKQ